MHTDDEGKGLGAAFDAMDRIVSVLMFLSLDLADPAFADLGIDPGKAPRVREITRLFVTEWERATPEDPYSRYDPVWPP